MNILDQRLAELGYWRHTGDDGRYWDIRSEIWLIETQGQHYASVVVNAERMQLVLRLLRAELGW